MKVAAIAFHPWTGGKIMRVSLAIGMLALLVSCQDSTVGSPNGGSTSSSSPAPDKSKLISQGTAFSKADYLIPGYVTILDFYADW